MTEGTEKIVEEKTKPLWKSLLRVVLIFIGIIGATGFLAGFVCAVASRTVNPQTLTSVRFPLSVVDGACVDRDGNIYCITDFYKRIQVYDSNGSFLCGWFVPFDKVNTGIEINKKSQVVAYNVAWKQRFTYSTKGEILARDDMTEDNQEKMRKQRRDPFMQSLDGCGYSLSSNTVCMINPTTNKMSVVLADPWYLSWTKGPFLAWLWFAFGLVGLSILDKKKVKKEKTEPVYYCFVGQTKEGTEKQGLIQASTDTEAAKIIKKHNMFPTKMTIATEEEKEQYAGNCLS